MKVSKKDIGKICIIKWWDAQTSTRSTLREVQEKGFPLVESIGWLASYDLKRVIICSEKTGFGDEGDYTILPRGWIKDIDILDMED